MATIRGGARLQRSLDATVAKLTTANAVRVGYLEGATYPTTDRSVEQLLKGLDSLNSVGPFRKGERPNALRRFRKRQREFVGPRPQGVVAVLPVATVAAWNNWGNSRTPARPFFTDMITEGTPRWGSDLAKVLVAAGYNTRVALLRMGVVINDQLVKKIVDWPADNAPLTERIKGFNKGLIHKGVMQRSSAYEIVS